ASNQNMPLRTSLRSLIHATDSTWRGWIANSAATSALGHSCAVIFRITTNSNMTLTMCSATLVKWNPRGQGPENCRSAINESQTIGFQLPIVDVVNAQPRLLIVNPRFTNVLSRT